MSNFKKNIDEMVSKILNEEIENKVRQITESEGEWTEIETKEALKGGQKKLDVAEPKGKLDAADFKKLRNQKKETKESEEIDEFFHFNDGDESIPGDYEGDEEAEEEAEELSAQEPTYVGKGLEDNEPGNMFGSFDEEYGLEEEAETEEGNEFGLAVRNAKEAGKTSFDFHGERYPVKEAKEKWIQKTHMKKGALHKKLGVPEGDKIPQSKLKSLKKELMKKAEGDKKLSKADSTLLKQVNLALTLKSVKESVNTLQLTENELIDLIEKIVVEQQVKDTDEKDNISKKSPEGLKKTMKALEGSKKENDDYAGEVVKKMKDYMKDMFMGGKGYEENPETFPQSNYDMEKEHKEMKYNPSEAVEEYIDAFAYPGMTNLVYDEIKPDDERIGKQLKGDSSFGNAVTDKKGKALGNVVPSKVGEKFKKNYDENIYGAEQMKASYKRQPQPVEVEGGGTKGSLKSKKGADKPSSIAKASKILNTLESTEDKKVKVVSEEMEKMKNLISYSRKTQ